MEEGQPPSLNRDRDSRIPRGQGRPPPRRTRSAFAWKRSPSLPLRWGLGEKFGSGWGRGPSDAVCGANCRKRSNSRHRSRDAPPNFGLTCGNEAGELSRGLLMRPRGCDRCDRGGIPRLAATYGKLPSAPIQGSRPSDWATQGAPNQLAIGLGANGGAWYVPLLASIPGPHPGAVSNLSRRDEMSIGLESAGRRLVTSTPIGQPPFWCAVTGGVRRCFAGGDAVSHPHPERSPATCGQFTPQDSSAARRGRSRAGVVCGVRDREFRSSRTCGPHPIAV